MNNQLSSISTQYRKFVEGQYVDHEQFNEFLDFFEDQDRLSRVLLHGVGIVCGFKPQPVYLNGKVSRISLSQGIAITTDGDLLTLNNKGRAKNISDGSSSEFKTINFAANQYTHWKPYDNGKAKYPAFYNSNQQIELWELATVANVSAGFKPLNTFQSFEDKYLLLYLEAYEKEIKPCRGVDCDNHGVELIQNLKVLVTTSAGISRIMNGDNLYTHPIFSDFIGEKKLGRVILDPVQYSPVSLKQEYKNITSQSNYYASLFNNLSAISSFFSVPQVSQADKDAFVQTLNSVADNSKNFQYAYEVLKDLTDTYLEIIKLVPGSFTKVMPDFNSFPKHVMLGKLGADIGSDSTRHKFYNSPVLDKDKTDKRIKLLVERFNMLIKNFKIPTDSADEEGIKIIPSMSKTRLGSKAIPFYYNLTEDFLHKWNFDKTINRAGNTNLSFDTTLFSQSAHVKNPIGFTIDKKSFYRIEGHHGVDYKNVISYLRRYKKDNQLGFDLMALSLEQLSGNKDISKAYFTDYVKKHPGLEYLGGVKRGGTFIVVYESESNPSVIADFSLPYICCTPKSDVALSLPFDKICKDASPIVFNITPSNGVVKANINNETLRGGVQEDNGIYRFNPSIVSPQLLNQEIGFTVNDKPTNCFITVVSNLEVKVIVQNIIHTSDEQQYTTVVFNVSNPNTGYEYKWDFLGNRQYITMVPDYQGNVEYKYLKVDESKPVNVKISANGCTQDIILEDWYYEEPIESPGPTIEGFTTDMTIAYAPEARVLLSSSIRLGNNSPITSYVWTSDSSNAVITVQGSSSTGLSVSVPGSYKITLTVRDANNKTATKDVTVVVGTKARVTGVTISPTNPTTESEVIATAVVLNPDILSGLEYEWSLDGVVVDTTTSNTRSFGI